jgi:hypothetical protein
LTVSFVSRNRFTNNGTTFERIRCVRALSSIGNNGRIARGFFAARIVIDRPRSFLLRFSFVKRI